MQAQTCVAVTRTSRNICALNLSVCACVCGECVTLNDTQHLTLKWSKGNDIRKLKPNQKFRQPNAHTHTLDQKIQCQGEEVDEVGRGRKKLKWLGGQLKQRTKVGNKISLEIYVCALLMSR